jgi:hypothetical protein
MANAVINSLPEPEWLLVKETERSALAALTEDELLDLHTRVRRARGKYVTNYRRGASARVSSAGGRGKARPQNTQARDRAEVFEAALARVSAALSTAAKRSAAELKAERLAAAKAAKAGATGAATTSTRSSAPRASGRTKAAKPSTVTPRSLKKSAGSAAQGARRQAKRDSRTS